MHKAIQILYVLIMVRKKEYWVFMGLLTLSGLLLSACNIRKEKLKVCIDPAPPLSVSSGISMDNQFRLFLDDLKKELKTESPEGYTPSAVLIERYGLSEQRGRYYVSGFVRVSNEFTPPKSENNEIVFVRYSSNLYTFRVSILMLDNFLHINGILRIELAQKVRMKLIK